MTDPIADFLTRIRNAIRAGHKVVEIPGSRLKQEMTKILKEKGYILNYKFEQDGVRSNIKIALKYHPETKAPAIRALTRVSKPGLRRYTNVDDMPRVLNGLGIAILSTSMGVMTDKEARDSRLFPRAQLPAIQSAGTNQLATARHASPRRGLQERTQDHTPDCGQHHLARNSGPISHHRRVGGFPPSGDRQVEKGKIIALNAYNTMTVLLFSLSSDRK